MEIIIHKTQQDLFNGFLDLMTPKEYYIMLLRENIKTKSKTLEEVGTLMNVTRERIRQIESKTHEKIKKYIKEQPLFTPKLIQEIINNTTEEKNILLTYFDLASILASHITREQTLK